MPVLPVEVEYEGEAVSAVSCTSDQLAEVDEAGSEAELALTLSLVAVGLSMTYPVIVPMV